MDTFSMVRGIQARRIAAQAEAERDCAVTAPPLLPLVDARPVRGVVTLQARPLLRSTDRPMSVLLVVNRSMLVVQTLQKPYRDLLDDDDPFIVLTETKFRLTPRPHGTCGAKSRQHVSHHCQVKAERRHRH
jgi:hypothetical protein